jgi:hypothetical protein
VGADAPEGHPGEHAQVRNLGDVRWLATEDGSAGKGTGRHIAAFILESAEVLMSESSLHSKASAWDKIQAKLTELTGSEEWLRGEGNGTQCAIAVIERFARSAIVRRSPDEIDLICDAYIAKTAEFQCPPKFYSHLREALHAILRPTDSCTPNDV